MFWLIDTSQINRENHPNETAIKNYLQGTNGQKICSECDRRHISKQMIRVAELYARTTEDFLKPRMPIGSECYSPPIEQTPAPQRRLPDQQYR